MSRNGEINIFQINYRLLQFINYKKFDYYKDEFKKRIKIFTDEYTNSVDDIKSISKKEYIVDIIIPLFYLIYGYVYKKYNEKQIERRNVNNNQLICNMFNFFFDHKNPAIIKANAYYYIRFKQEKEDDKKSNTSNIYLLGYFKNQNESIKNFLKNFIIKYLDKCFDIEEYNKVILIKNNIDEMGKNIKNILEITNKIIKDATITKLTTNSLTYINNITTETKNIENFTLIKLLNEILKLNSYQEIKNILDYIYKIQENIYNINKNALFLNKDVNLIKLEDISVVKYNELKEKYYNEYKEYSKLKEKKDIVKKNIDLLIKNNDSEIELLQDLFQELQKSILNSNKTDILLKSKTNVFLKSIKEYDNDITNIINNILNNLFSESSNKISESSNKNSELTINNYFNKISENTNYLNQSVQLYFLSLIINNGYKYTYLNDITMLNNGKLSNISNNKLEKYDNLNINKIQDIFIENLRKYKKKLVTVTEENNRKIQDYTIELSKLPFLNDLKKPDFNVKLNQNIEKKIENKKKEYNTDFKKSKELLTELNMLNKRNKIISLSRNNSTKILPTTTLGKTTPESTSIGTTPTSATIGKTPTSATIGKTSTSATIGTTETNTSIATTPKNSIDTITTSTNAKTTPKNSSIATTLTNTSIATTPISTSIKLENKGKISNIN